MYREKRKERRACTYEAAVKGGEHVLYRSEKEREEVMYI